MVKQRSAGPATTLPLEIPRWMGQRAKVMLRDDGNKWSIVGEARLGARLVARMVWHRDSGRLSHVKKLDSAGRPHGLEVEYDDSGRASWCAEWVHGKMHGFSMQFDEHGKPILVTEFVRGRGVDLFGSRDGVSEYRELLDGQRHGVERWGPQQRLADEGMFFHGQRHGIFRRWEDDELCRGFPRFYVMDERASRRAYLKAQASDETLPPYRERDDSNRRPLPAVVRDALARARALRRELAFIEKVRNSGAS